MSYPWQNSDLVYLGISETHRSAHDIPTAGEKTSTRVPEPCISNISPTFSYANILSETRKQISVYRNVH